MRFSLLGALAVILLAPASSVADATSPGPTAQPTPSNPNPSTRAAEPSSKEASPIAENPPVETTWYGWQTLATDALSIGFVAVGASNQSGGVSLLGVTTYLLGGPAVHAFHGRAAAAGTSAGIRLVAPFVGAGLGYGIGQIACSNASKDSPDVTCPEALAFVGLLGGLLSAMLVDSIVVANEPDKAANASMFRLAPAVAFGRVGAQVGVVGAF